MSAYYPKDLIQEELDEKSLSRARESYEKLEAYLNRGELKNEIKLLFTDHASIEKGEPQDYKSLHFKSFSADFDVASVAENFFKVHTSQEKSQLGIVAEVQRIKPVERKELL